jgi:hypothetical protein
LIPSLSLFVFCWHCAVWRQWKTLKADWHCA